MRLLFKSLRIQMPESVVLEKLEGLCFRVQGVMQFHFGDRD